MEARISDDLPPGSDWQFEPKWDGFRCLVFLDGSRIRLQGKSGKSLSPYFPEILAALRRVRASKFVLDGELVLPQSGALSFDALQARLHPAESRRRRLAAETPAKLVLFDLLAGARSLLGTPLLSRRRPLEILFRKMQPGPEFILSPQTRECQRVRAWLADAGAGILDGIMAKALGSSYRMGERLMLKIKPQKTADCVVGGFRYATNSKLVGSLLLGLYDKAGKLNHVGFTSGIARADRPELTANLEKLKGGSGFTGAAPGGPSRWSNERSSQWVPVKPKLVVEIRYDYVSNGRLRHGTRLLRWRPDKNPKSCSIAQLQRSKKPAALTGLAARS